MQSTVRSVDEPPADAALPSPPDSEAPPTDEDLLTQLADAWLDSRDAMVKKEFFAEARALLDDGQPGVVIEVCQRLIGRANRPALIAELMELMDEAWDLEPPSLDSRPAPASLAARPPNPPAERLSPPRSGFLRRFFGPRA